MSFKYIPSTSRLWGKDVVNNLNRAVFLDRDGVLINNVHYLSDPNEIEIIPESVSGLLLLAQHFLLIIVTNQSGIARGLFNENTLQTIHDELLIRYSDDSVAFDGIYYCPHLPEASSPEYGVECNCRKPKPGMLNRASAEHGIDLANSVMVGDSLTDVQAGKSAGVFDSILIGRDAKNLLDAAKMILSNCL